MTVDNVLKSVTYGDNELSVSGNMGAWNKAKTMTFEADRCKP